MVETPLFVDITVVRVKDILVLLVIYVYIVFVDNLMVVYGMVIVLKTTSNFKVALHIRINNHINYQVVNYFVHIVYVRKENPLPGPIRGLTGKPC